MGGQISLGHPLLARKKKWAGQKEKMMGHLSFPLWRTNRALLFHSVHPHKSTARFGRRERGERRSKGNLFLSSFSVIVVPLSSFFCPGEEGKCVRGKDTLPPFRFSIPHTQWEGGEKREGERESGERKGRLGSPLPLASLIYGENGRESGLWWNMGRRPSLGAKGRGKAVSAGRIAL